MGCEHSETQLWSWIDREAPELDGHLAECAECRRRAGKIREDIRAISADLSEVVPLPDRVGSYRVKGLLGEGGQAFVYEAEQDSPRRTIALKVLRGGRFAGKRHIKHFLRETRTLAALQHPSIATIFEAGRTDDGLHWFAMELVRGQPLHRYLQNTDLSREERLELFRKICQAVQYAHENGVVHRDLKPANILVTDTGDPKILDFGLAHLVKPEMETTFTLTRTGLMSGTPRYMSPEQVMGHADDLGTPSDVYSLGVILYEILTGQPPHDTDSFTPETVMAIWEMDPVRPGKLDSTLSGDLETIVLTALAKEPRKRYTSAAGLAEDLKRFLAREPILARGPSVFYRVGKTLSRHRVAAVLLSVILVMVLTAGWWVLKPPYDRDEARASMLQARYQFFLANPANRVQQHSALTAPDRYPDLVEAHLLRALALTRAGERGLALQYLADLMDKDPDQWTYRALRSQIGVEQDAGVEEAFDPWARRDGPGGLSESWYLRSFATFDSRAALDFSLNALTYEPDHQLALENVARLGAVTGDLEASLRATDRLIEMDEPQVVGWRTFKSTLLCRLGRPREARDEITFIIEKNPGVPRHYVARAQTHRWLGDYEAAVADYDQAIAYSQGERLISGWYYYHRGVPLWILGRPAEAVQDYRMAFRRLARTTFGNVRLVIILREMGKEAEAEAALQGARQRVEDDDWLAMILALLAGEISPGELVTRAAPDNLQEQCESRYYAGEFYLQNGNANQAREMFTAVVDVGLAIDQRNYVDKLSEFELAEWRLRQLDAGMIGQ